MNMTIAQQQFVTDPNGEFDKASLGMDHPDRPLIVAALEARFSDSRPWWAHPLTGRYAAVVVSHASVAGATGYELRLYNGGSGRASTNYVVLTPAHRFGSGKRYFKVREITV